MDELESMQLLIKDKIVLIDREDYEKIEHIVWHINDSGYVVWRGVMNGRKQTIRMHRLITNCPDGKVVDHVNHNTLDNRKHNLRVCTQKENTRNRLIVPKNYWLHNQNHNWVVDIYGKRIGSFPTEEDAKKIVLHIRNGGIYEKPEKPERTECKSGHSLKDAYYYGKSKQCRPCQIKRSKEYHAKKTKTNAIHG